MPDDLHDLKERLTHCEHAAAGISKHPLRDPGLMLNLRILGEECLAIAEALKERTKVADGA